MRSRHLEIRAGRGEGKDGKQKKWKRKVETGGEEKGRKEN